MPTDIQVVSALLFLARPFDRGDRKRPQPKSPALGWGLFLSPLSKGRARKSRAALCCLSVGMAFLIRKSVVRNLKL